jgi:hypothetical protein
MPEFNPRARETTRGQHPDIDPETGDIKPDVDLPPARREFYRMWQDEAQRDAFMARLARQQVQLPQDVQRAVAGQQYSADGGDPYAGYMAYLADIQQLRQVGNEVTGRDVSQMTAEEYDALFDARGQPRQGVTYSPTGRDVDVANRGGRIDPFSEQELRNR